MKLRLKGINYKKMYVDTGFITGQKTWHIDRFLVATRNKMDAPIDVLFWLYESELRKFQSTLDKKKNKRNPTTGCKEVINGRE